MKEYSIRMQFLRNSFISQQNDEHKSFKSRERFSLMIIDRNETVT